VIKRVRFATRRRDLAPDAFASAWPQAFEALCDAPPDARPSRVTVCATLPELTDGDPKHDGLGFEWFGDAAHLARFESWLGTPDGRAASAAIDALLDEASSPLLVADERVLRGEEWLVQRWHDGGPKLKHLAIALRASDLSAAEFSERWRSHAGQVGRPGTAGAAVIPEAARGLAYVQDHPRPRAEGEWAYDALNEVWFDDIAGLQTRIDWFRENPPASADDDLFRRSWFLAAREDVVLP
jgi:hypothetical protein